MHICWWQNFGHLVRMEWQLPDDFPAKPEPELASGLRLCGFCCLAPCSPESHREETLLWAEPVGLLLHPPSWESPGVGWREPGSRSHQPWLDSVREEILVGQAAEVARFLRQLPLIIPINSPPSLSPRLQHSLSLWHLPPNTDTSILSLPPHYKADLSGQRVCSGHWGCNNGRPPMGVRSVSEGGGPLICLLGVRSSLSSSCDGVPLPVTHCCQLGSFPRAPGDPPKSATLQFALSPRTAPHQLIP